MLYDVANSAFILLATSILPIYFNQLAGNAGLSEDEYLAYWSLGAAVVTILMLFIGPMLGALSDRRGWRKPIFVTVVLAGVLSCIALGFPTWWVAFLIIFIISKIAFNASLVVSDGMLNDVTTYDRMDDVSSKAYALGYIGSCIPFVVCLVFVVMSDMMNQNSPLTFESAVFVSLVITAVWWLVMSLPLFKRYEQKCFVEQSTSFNEEEVKARVFNFVSTLKEISHNKAMALFLVAFFFYIDGVNTIIELSTAYGSALKLDSLGLLGALFVAQLVAFPSTLIMDKLAYKYGTHIIIGVCIIGYTVISVYALFLSNIIEFFVMAMAVGLFQGAIQALSRSYFGRMIPKEKTGEYFGIMDVFGKGATIIGTLAVAAMEFITGEPRFLVLILVVMFGIGLFFFVSSVRVKVYNAEKQ